MWFPLRKWYKITIGQDNMWPGHIKRTFILSHSAHSLLHIWCKWIINHDKSTGMGLGQTKCVVYPSLFPLYACAGLPPTITKVKIHCFIQQIPLREVIFSGRKKKNTFSVQELPVVPKFGDEKCSPRICLCFSRQLIHSPTMNHLAVTAFPICHQVQHPE